MTVIANNGEFEGKEGQIVRQASAGAGDAGTLQVRIEDPAGAVEWVDVPDGALTGPTNITFYCIANQRYRFSSVTGSIWVS